MLFPNGKQLNVQLKLKHPGIRCAFCCCCLLSCAFKPNKRNRKKKTKYCSKPNYGQYKNLEKKCIPFLMLKNCFCFGAKIYRSFVSTPSFFNWMRLNERNVWADINFLHLHYEAFHCVARCNDLLTFIYWIGLRKCVRIRTPQMSA